MHEYPVRLPVPVGRQQDPVLEIPLPGRRIILPLPLVEGNRPERLFDFEQLLRFSTASVEVAVVMHDAAADHFENRFQNGLIRSVHGPFAQYVGAPPAALDRRIKLPDRIRHVPEMFELAGDGEHLPIHEIVGIQHEVGCLVGCENGGPGRIRTVNLLIQSQMLYLVELRGWGIGGGAPGLAGAPHSESGLTNGTRTRTAAFTGRDAALTS